MIYHIGKNVLPTTLYSLPKGHMATYCLHSGANAFLAPNKPTCLLFISCFYYGSSLALKLCHRQLSFNIQVILILQYGYKTTHVFLGSSVFQKYIFLIYLFCIRLMRHLPLADQT